ncbi:MAG TPA: TIGR03087 family PEP-CTERM/XrtA system glycosyltransferase [Noviherbaspirillum sp.]|nr:TIGR03087 family PEP-CTERM/XrtA system glycosyltransferase [Noviherbaspirillum sp.]
MEHLLLLVHRLPYPPNKGDKIRSYHLLAHLAQRFHVHLGTFVDDPDDWQHVETVKRLCGESHFAALNPFTAKLRGVKALTMNRPLTVDYYCDSGLQEWVRKVMAEQPISRVLVFSSAMAQYAAEIPNARRIIDFVDIDSDKWLQYAENIFWPMRWIYRREGELLLRYERKISKEFDASLFVSEAEAALFRQRAPESALKTGFFSNGVDTDYFSPSHTYTNPYQADEAVIVFTGAMDYWPNIDAARWFALDILPAVRVAYPAAVFYIVGSRPTEQVQQLARIPGVRVTGTVPDVRPYIAHARVSVAPLRIARGIQNKVLEAMAMEKQVVVSPPALEGITAVPGNDLILADGAVEFASSVSKLLAEPNASLGRNARDKVIRLYGWASNLAHVDALLSPEDETVVLTSEPHSRPICESVHT